MILTRKPSADLIAQLTRWKNDRMAFRREAIILEDGRPFGEVIEPWQVEDFIGVDSHRNSYLERPRGHSKTGDTGTDIVTDLMLGPTGQRNIASAVDRDQAALLLEDVIKKFQRNPLLRPLAKTTRDSITIKATDSQFRVMASDGPSAMGLRFRRAYIDELSEQANREMWDALWTATGKYKDCGVHVISTAGWDRDSIAWKVREMARTEDDWYFSTRGQCASWVRPEWLEQQRRSLPPHVFSRLHECRWVDGVGAFLTGVEVNGVFIHVPVQLTDGAVAGGLDIGLTRDRTVFTIARNVGGLIVVQHMVTWAGAPGRKVDLEEVATEVSTLAKRYQCPVYFDPYQGIHLAQQLRRQGVNMTEYAFTGESRKQLFTTLLDLIRNGRLRSQPHEELRRELLSLEVQQTASGGWRVDHKTGRHDDHVVAVALAAQALAGKGTGVITLEAIEATMALNNLVPAMSIPATGSIYGQRSDLENLIEQQRAANAELRGTGERPVDWMEEQW
jgi:hypothetical protein